jgi:4-amino-4-deoxy-L-arabinose transferase-like glycosyltransferase
MSRLKTNCCIPGSRAHTEYPGLLTRTARTPGLLRLHLFQAKKVGEAWPLREGSRWTQKWSTIYWLVVIGFVLRMALMVFQATYRFEKVDDFCNIGETSRIAASIARGHGFSSPFGDEYTGPSAWIGPIYPYFLAFIYRRFGIWSHTSSFVLFTIQALFSALTAIPIFGIAKRTVGEQTGFWAALTWAVFPWFGHWSVNWVWEISLSALLLAFLFWCALCVVETDNKKAWLGFGALFGFCLLVNPALTTFVPVSLAWCMWKLRERGGQWLKFAGAAVVACAIMISPWVARNRIVFGQWVFLRSNFGFEFGLGNYHLSFGRGWGGKHPSGNAKDYANYINMGEIAYVHMKEQEGIQFVREYPWEFITLTAKRAQYFWDGSAMGYRWPIPWYWFPSSFALFSFLLLPGCFFLHRRSIRAWPMFFGAFLLYPLPYYLTYSQVRYRHAIEPLMLIAVTYAAIESVAWLRNSSRWFVRQPREAYAS